VTNLHIYLYLAKRSHLQHASPLGHVIPGRQGAEHEISSKAEEKLDVPLALTLIIDPENPNTLLRNFWDHSVLT
jgi:hypothetical protein